MPGFESFSAGVVLWIAAVTVLAGFVHGALGLGFPIVATPLIALVSDIRSAVILVLLPCLATVVASVIKGGPVRQVLSEFWAMPIYAFCGALLGTRLFITFPAVPFSLLLAAVILIYLNLDRLGGTDWPWIRKRRQLCGALFGFIGGLAEGTANIAAPPLIVYYLAIGISPSMLVQALNLCFLSGKMTQFATLTWSGGVSPVQWLITLPLAVLAVAALLAGVHIRDRIDAATYRVWLKRALFVIALILLAQYAYAAIVGLHR